VLAVGGGSVLDGTNLSPQQPTTTTLIDPWEILETYGSKIASAIPMGSPLPATGSESNKGR
jgi:NADP-dependent alcohol dehydrogenase